MLLQREPAGMASEENAALACCHHWIIEPANGPISRGMCRNCREVREFKNSIVDVERDFPDVSLYAKADASGSVAPTAE